MPDLIISWNLLVNRDLEGNYHPDPSTIIRSEDPGANGLRKSKGTQDIEKGAQATVRGAGVEPDSDDSPATTTANHEASGRSVSPKEVFSGPATPDGADVAVRSAWDKERNLGREVEQRYGREQADQGAVHE